MKHNKLLHKEEIINTIGGNGVYEGVTIGGSPPLRFFKGDFYNTTIGYR